MTEACQLTIGRYDESSISMAIPFMPHRDLVPRIYAIVALPMVANPRNLDKGHTRGFDRMFDAYLPCWETHTILLTPERGGGGFTSMAPSLYSRRMQARKKQGRGAGVDTRPWGICGVRGLEATRAGFIAGPNGKNAKATIASSPPSLSTSPNRQVRTRTCYILYTISQRRCH